MSKLLNFIRLLLKSLLGAFMTDKYLTSCKFSDARELWFSKRRAYTGSFIRVIPMSTSMFSPDQKKEFFDTGFFCHFVGANDAGSVMIGSISHLQYIKENPGREVIITGSSFYPNRYYSSVPIYEGSAGPGSHPSYNPDGSHFGNETDPPGGTNPTKDIRLRFQDSNGNPLDQVHTYSLGSIIRFSIPVVDETIELIASAYLYHWVNNAWYGQKLVDFLLENGITPTGIFSDWEDFPYEFVETGTPTNKSLYLQDPRFGPSGTWMTMRANNIKLIDARLTALRNQTLSWCQDEFCQLYDLTSPNAHEFQTFSHPWLRKNGRKIASVNLYPHYSSFTDIKDMVEKRGVLQSRWYALGVQNFNLWTSAGLKNAGDDPDNPTQNSVSIAELIGAVKLFMVLGGITVNQYSGAGWPTHGIWSALIAFDEMQPYANVIKFGTTHIPSDKRYIQYAYDNSTPYYNLDDSNVFVACRYYSGEVIFCGLSTNGSYGSVSVPDHNGVMRTVRYSPYGHITQFTSRNKVSFVEGSLSLGVDGRSYKVAGESAAVTETKRLS